jgi:DNA-binding NarL/FixJ family response regulator
MDSSRLAAAHAAQAAHRWEEAADAFRATLAQADDDPAAYEGLAQCAWWLDDGDQCLRARETAYRGYSADGDRTSAARAATALAWDALLFGEGAAVAQGWLGRARALLEALPEQREHGWLALRRGELAHAAHHDPAGALVAAREAADVGRRHGDADLEHAGTALAGLALVVRGDIAAGMAQLDVAAAAATAGDVRDPMWMGKICCWLIVACAQAQDVERAIDWCRRIAAVSEQQGLLPLFNVCRVRYAELCILRGDWAGADVDLCHALERLSVSRRDTRLSAVVQLGELRRRQGRLDEAEGLLGQAEFLTAAQVGRALITLERGDPLNAWRVIGDVLNDIPEAAQLDRAAVLPSAVVVALAAAEHGAAAAAASELHAVAQRIRTKRLLGLAAVATARLASGAEAVTGWRTAVRDFSSAELPLDEAEAREGLAAALLAVGDTAEARKHADRACVFFEQVGAPQRAAAVRARFALAQEPPGPLSERQLAVLALVADGSTNSQIAQQLHLSEHTVHRHLSNIFTVLGVKSRAAATAYAIRHGLVGVAGKD